MQRLLLRPEEVGVLIGLSRARVYRLLSDGELPSVRLGGAVRVPAEALRRWITAKSTEPDHVGNARRRAVQETRPA